VNEKQWLDCTQVARMLPQVRYRLGPRKLRLLACACCRRAWHLLTAERSRRAIALAERFADGLVNADRLQQAYVDAQRAVSEGRGGAETAAAVVAAQAANPHLDERSRPERLASALDELARSTVWVHRPGRPPLAPGWCAALLRDLVGPLSQRVPFDASWRTPDALALARRADEERDFSVLPMLGDALEDAGCAEPALLEHCRAGAVHGRGCWAVEAVLGKA
jgi:hypothetical protein